ncbi:hypothetical protein [Bacillus safensis]|nr:hypothetical protein [Bacillus safensis]
MKKRRKPQSISNHGLHFHFGNKKETLVCEFAHPTALNLERYSPIYMLIIGNQEFEYALSSSLVSLEVLFFLKN